MAARSRHAKPKSRASKFGPVAAAAATLAGVAAAFVLLQGSPASAGPPRPAPAPMSAGRGSALADNLVTTAIHRAYAAQARAYAERAAAAARRRHRAERAAQRARRSPAPTQSTPPSSGNAAQSALGICIRNAEEGGSYAWGPGNGGGAYQFLLSTWERYGGAASEFGVAGPAYQDRIFDNAIAAGGASNWTDYDGC